MNKNDLALNIKIKPNQIVGNGIGDPKTNSGRDSFLRANVLKKGIDTSSNLPRIRVNS